MEKTRSDQSFIEVAEARAIAPNTYVIAEAGEYSVLIANIGGDFFAVENKCSHAASVLEGGRMKMGRISCPLHGAIYDLRTGAPVGSGLTPLGLRIFDTRVIDGRLEVSFEPRAPLGSPFGGNS